MKRSFALEQLRASLLYALNQVNHSIYLESVVRSPKVRENTNKFMVDNITELQHRIVALSKAEE